MEKLFGKGQVLHEKRPLSPKGTVFKRGARNPHWTQREKKGTVAVLGPVRKATQVELSVSDCVALGVQAPLRESGDVKDSAPMIIEGPAGSIAISEGTIVAHNRIHVPTEVAENCSFSDKEPVSVKILTERPVTFDDVIIRVSDAFNFKMHIDLDKRRKCSVSKGIYPGQDYTERVRSAVAVWISGKWKNL